MPQTTAQKKNASKTTLTIAMTLVAALMLTVGCGSSSNPSASLNAFQPEIINNADAFSFQATAVENVTATMVYTWQNTGQQATINHSSAVDSGTVSVTILDANGTQVYANPLVASLNEPTAAGVAGAWTVTVVVTNVYGTLNFRADKL